jgi:hypothetical protein
MIKRPLHIAPVLAMLLMWPGLYQSFHRFQHHLPAPKVEECCHHHCAAEEETETQNLVINEFEHCFVCDFEFALYQDVQFANHLGSINLPGERILVFNITFHHKSNKLQLRPRGPPALV